MFVVIELDRVVFAISECLFFVTVYIFFKCLSLFTFKFS